MRLIRFIKALWRYILHGKKIDFHLYVYRLETCDKCEHLDSETWKCKICGCYLDKKCKMDTEKCPENNWNV